MVDLQQTLAQRLSIVQASHQTQKYSHLRAPVLDIIFLLPVFVDGVKRQKSAQGTVLCSMPVRVGFLESINCNAAVSTMHVLMHFPVD